MLPALLFSSCSVKKYLGEDEYLMNKAKIKGAPPKADEDLMNLVKPKPNSRFLGIGKWRMRIFILFDNDKEKGLAYWLRKNIGERPVILDSTAVEQAVMQMDNYMFNEGYFQSRSSYEVDPNEKRKRAKVTFNIEPYIYYGISHIEYYIQDRILDSIVTSDSANSLIHPGQRYDSNVLSQERERLTTLIRNQGYYNFNREYIYFEVPVDTTSIVKNVKVGIGITLRQNYEPHKVFYIDTIFVEPDYRVLYPEQQDTFTVEGVVFVANRSIINPKVLKDFIFFEPGDEYRIEDEKSTINKIAGLNLFKFVDVKYVEKGTRNDSSLLDAFIRLTPYRQYDLLTDLELRTREENQQITQTPVADQFYGIAGSITLRNKNLFRSAIQHDIRLRGGLEYQTEDIGKSPFLGDYQFGVSTGLNFPRGFVPWKFRSVALGVNSITSLNLAYLFEKNSDFKRQTGTFKYYYQLQRDKFTYLFTPFEISLVSTDRTPEFDAILERFNNPLITNLFDRHLLMNNRFTAIFTDKPRTQGINYWYIKATPMESGGLLLYGIKKWLSPEPPPGRGEEINTYQFAGVDFYQYYKTELDVRFYQVFNEHEQMAYRLSGGIGLPYGNSKVMPFEKRFFIGGSSSVRAWRNGQLGPGSYRDTRPLFQRIDQSGEILLEGNTEYRFDMGDITEGAIFMDFGNIWTLNDTTRAGSIFYLDQFYKQIAISGGIGLRLDFSFFIFRTDLAYPLRDPSLVSKRLFSLDNPRLNDIRLNFGIGYPF